MGLFDWLDVLSAEPPVRVSRSFEMSMRAESTIFRGGEVVNSFEDGRI